MKKRAAVLVCMLPMAVACTAIAKGYDIDYTPVESVAISDAPNTMDQLCENYDIILVHGAQFTSACTEMAQEYPDSSLRTGHKRPDYRR